MATTVGVKKKIRQRQALYEAHARIRNEVEHRTRLSRPPQPLFTPTVITGLRAGLSTLQPAYQQDASWPWRRQHLLQVARLFASLGSSFAIPQPLVQRTTEVLEAFDQSVHDCSATQPRELTEADREQVRRMVETLAPVFASKPPHEARAWVVDFVAMAFFTPCTVAVDELDDDDAAAVLVCGLELAFIAARFAGELWDQ